MNHQTNCFFLVKHWSKIVDLWLVYEEHIILLFCPTLGLSLSTFLPHYLNVSCLMSL